MRPPLRFGEFAFDRDRRQLLRGAQPVPLPPKAFELLGLLLERRPEAVSKAEIRDRIWPDTVVSDASLPRLANAVRSALGDDAEAPRFLRTVHGFGYAFCGDVDVERGPLRLPAAYLVWSNRRLPLHRGPNVVGRDPENDVWIDAATVSRRHARIVVGAEAATIEDLGSKNGTRVRNQPVAAPHALVNGDAVRLGKVSMTFHRRSGASSTRTESKRRVGRRGSR